MTDDDFLQLDQMGIEWPDGALPFEDQADSIRMLQKELSNLLGLDLEMTDSQDATFTFQLMHDILSNSKNNQRECVIAFTFSNFGQLVLAWGNKKWMHDNQNILKHAYDTIEKNGYKLVSEEDLSRAYIGTHKWWIGKTWSNRFFDWI